MSYLNYQIQVINQYYGNPQWVTQNTDHIQRTLDEALNSDQYALQAVDTVLSIYQTILCCLSTTNLERWIKLLYEALLVVQRLRDNPTQVRIWIFMGRSYALLQRASSARTAFNVALERAELEQDWHLVLELYIELFQLHQQDQLGDIVAYQVKRAHELALDLSNQQLTASLNQYLSIAYGFRGEIEQAEVYAHTAIAHWRDLNNRVEMARTACGLSASYRSSGHYALATNFLEEASKLYATTDEPRQHAIIPFENAQHLASQGDYENAYHWLEKCHREMSGKQMTVFTPRDIAACLFSMGNVAMLKQAYTVAQTHLLDAFDLWQHYVDPYHHSLVYNSLSQLQIYQGDLDTAHNLIQQAQMMLPEIPPSPRTTALKAMIADTNSQLQ